MKSKKLIRNVLVMLSTIMMTTVMVLSGCGNAAEGTGEHASITISVGTGRAARAISDAEKSAATFNVYFNDKLVASNISGAYTGMAQVGTMLKIRLDALVNGKRIARGEDTIVVRAGSNNVSMQMSENREATAELKGVPQIGSIIMSDGSIRTADNIGNDTANAVAIVYKVAGGKAWAVGKVLSSSTMTWAEVSADGSSKDITALQEEKGYTDGSTGLAILRSAVTDANGSDLGTNYPAWDYACNYGKNQGLDSFQTGWYLPSKQELQEVYNNKAAIEAALAKTGVSKTSFGSTSYWSSSQYASLFDVAFYLSFGNGTVDGDDKFNINYVCAVRQFTF